MKDQYTNEQFDDFLSGKPNKKLEKALEQDAALQKEFQLHKDSILGIQQFGQAQEQQKIQAIEEELDQAGFFESTEVNQHLKALGEHDLQQKIKSTTQELEQEGFFEQSSKNTPIRKLGRFLAVAASLALLLWVGSQWLNSNQNTPNSFAQHFAPYPSQPMIEFIQKEQSETGFGGAPDQAALSLIQTAIKHYQEQDYPKAIEGFEQFIQTYPTHSLVQQVQFYTAIAHLAQQNPKQALPIFQQLQTANTINQQALNFYLGLAYSQNGEKEEAIQTLEKINKTGSYQEKAKTLLEELKKLE